MIRDKLKKFIENNIDLIENNQWEQLYKQLNANSITAGSDYIGEFTKIMLDAGINPLKSMQRIPSCYLKGQYIKSFTIPEHMVSIGPDAFSRTDLTSIVIPNNVTYIGLWAFAYCTDLTSVVISDSVTNIAAFVFYLCTKLKRVDYLGTKEQWDRISKSSEWAKDSAVATIHCTDDDIKIKN